MMVTNATRQLFTETIIDELQLIPELLLKAERKYYQIQQELAELREISDQPSPFSYGPQRPKVRDLEAEAMRLKAEIDFLLRRLDNYQVIARLLSR